ncbi:hypothetical protein [Streptomyces sp. S.PB5]|uniref:hypothetical protein n=1 Tax=Streptomyces sp. S.PB5 TaxID=3020844 RepID=UPI0025B1978B|nr:hypothetical protein [Streptomyces sp. S.PB5]MDN3029410.1 hypothetical protein [Streptomyces sp. S.PB5]
MVPTAKVFFEEVRTACAPAVAGLGLTGPDESDEIMPCSDYKGAVVEYRLRLNESEGTVGCSAMTETDTIMLTLDIEPLAMAVGVVEKRGGVSYSARNLRQLRKSLQGLVDYVQRVHPFFTDAATAQNVMRQAGAREWRKGGAS